MVWFLAAMTARHTPDSERCWADETIQEHQTNPPCNREADGRGGLCATHARELFGEAS